MPNDDRGFDCVLDSKYKKHVDVIIDSNTYNAEMIKMDTRIQVVLESSYLKQFRCRKAWMNKFSITVNIMSDT